VNQEEFLDLLCRFAERPMPALGGRHVYLWHGDVDPLGRALPGHTVRTLDLHALAASLSQAPSSMDGARRMLLRTIRPQIADLLSSDRQQVLVVTGCDLLRRYRVPLGSFFEIASEHTAVVFAVSPAETYFQPTEPLPEYVSLNPHAPLDYLRGALGEGAVIATVEESS
jgi:hypothetical protein